MTEGVARDAGSAVRIGISSCLLGAKVRYDGGHKKDDFLAGTFARWVEWVPVCPEVEAGMGTPREPIRLVREGEAVHLVGARSGADWTDRMAGFARHRVEGLAGAGLSGFVLKKDSPSCGMERVKVHGGGMPSRTGRGLFARELMARFPDLPVEEEGRLSDPRLRDNFVERVFAYHRVRELFGPRWTAGALVAFHTAHKLQLMAHSPEVYRHLGRLVSSVRERHRDEVREEYSRELMRGLRTIATPRRNTNVLQHIAGYFKKLLDDGSRRELAGLIEDYRQGVVPLVVPVTLIRHFVRLHHVSYLAGQTYLEPHPKELMLRNHV